MTAAADRSPLPEDLTPLDDFVGARSASGPADRRRELVKRATGLRERLMGARPVRQYRSFELVRFPYPAKYGFRDALALPVPFVCMANRLFVVRVDTAAGPRVLLVSPSDAARNAETPYFKDLGKGFGPAGPLAEKALATRGPEVRACLAEVGLRPAEVDYITYDHLHTQDLRGWIGPGGLFPRARLLVMRAEWESLHALTAPQLRWYCPRGAEGIDPARVILLDGDVMLGDSVALVATPGHTEGNHSIAVRTPEGVMVTSENGIASESWAPEHSRIPGLRAYARSGMDVVLNGNTLERGLDQYLSMIVEKTLAGPSARDPRFPNVVPSSELVAAWFAPGVRPTFAFGDLSFGA
ncbi:MAG: hypothetical protein U1F43_09855 [Myxococcota bacterium]